MRVLICEPGKKPKVKKIKNTLESLRAIVKGPIENVRIDYDLNLICNEEGKLTNLSPNIFIHEDIIAGPCIIAANDQTNEDYESLSMKQIHKALVGIALQNTNNGYLMQYAKNTYYKE